MNWHSPKEVLSLIPADGFYDEPESGVEEPSMNPGADEIDEFLFYLADRSTREPGKLWRERHAVFVRRKQVSELDVVAGPTHLRLGFKPHVL